MNYCFICLIIKFIIGRLLSNFVEFQGLCREISLVSLSYPRSRHARSDFSKSFGFTKRAIIGYA